MAGGPSPQEPGWGSSKKHKDKKLAGDLALDGFDPIEANSNAVCVEQNPVVTGDPFHGVDDSDKAKIPKQLQEKFDADGWFQTVFSETTKNDPDIAD